jgi:hypothetical protein
VKSTGEKVRVVIFPSTVMAKVAMTNGRLRGAGLIVLSRWEDFLTDLTNLPGNGFEPVGEAAGFPILRPGR